MYCVYFGETSIHRFQHKVVNHIYIYIYIFARLPLFLGTFTSSYLFGKRSQAFLPERPCALAAIQQIPVARVNDDLDVFTSFWTGQYVETWIASANLFLWTIIVHVILSLSFGRMTLVPFHVAGRLNLFNRWSLHLMEQQWPFGTNSRPWSSWGRSPPSRDVQTSWSRTAPCPVWWPKSKVWGKKGDPGCQTHQPSCCKIPVWSPATRGHASNVVNRSLQVVNNSRFSEMSKRQCLHISYVSMPLERPPEAELLQYQPAVLGFTSRIFCFESSADSL